MMKTTRMRQIDTIFVLIIFCVFAMSVLIVLSLSGNIYKNTVSLTQEKSDEHITLSFIWTKAKNGDALDAVYVDDFHGLPSLFLEEEYGEVTYLTTIYLYEGWIHELTYERGLELYPQDGVRIIRAESLELEQSESGFIKVTTGDDSLFISPRSKNVAFARTH